MDWMAAAVDVAIILEIVQRVAGAVAVQDAKALRKSVRELMVYAERTLAGR